jgi:hypothetical protein
MAEHPRGCSGAEHVGMVDVRAARAQRMRQRQHLAAQAGATDPTIETHRRVDQRLETEPFRQRRDQQQAGVGDHVRVVEGGFDPVEGMRYSSH